MATGNALSRYICADPMFQSGGGDFTLVSDAPAPTQAAQISAQLGLCYLFLDLLRRPRAVKYVTYNPTAAGSKAQGSPLYYKDNTRQVVTDNAAEAVTASVGHPEALFSFAGVQLGTAALMVVGNAVWIQNGGFCDKIAAPVGTVATDILVLSNSAAAAPTNNVYLRIAAGTDLTLIKAVFAAIFVTDSLAGGFAKGWIGNPVGIL